MKDLDFDELDRAVNSIMSGSKNARPDATPQPDAQATQSEPKVDAPSIDATDAPSTDMPMPMNLSAGDMPQEPAVQTPAPTEPEDDRKPPVTARRGRFMDMVRPGAAQPSESTVPARVSRQGATIERSGPLVTDIIPATAVTSPVVKKTPSEPVQAASVPSAPREAEWPDPLDMLQDTATEKDNDTAPAPLVSPFLSGTKVEKRPLGGALNQNLETDKPAVDETEPADIRDAHVQLAPNSAESASVPLPEELSSDVMALESDANTIAMPTDEVKTEVARQVTAQEEPKPPVPVEPSDQPATNDQAAETAASVSSPSPAVKIPSSSEPEPITPKGPISIPQQYREEPSTGDQENGAIYDTDTYHHQPLAHPKKKKSGWLWVVWIILILVVGAAGGAALFWLRIF